jgi:hypothetical protein
VAGEHDAVEIECLALEPVRRGQMPITESTTGNSLFGANTRRRKRQLWATLSRWYTTANERREAPDKARKARGEEKAAYS